MLLIRKIIIIFVFLISAGSAAELWRSSHAAPASGFKITQNTLGHLKREGVPVSMIEMLNPLVNQVYANKNDFLQAMPILFTPKHRDILLRYASMEHLKVQADEFTSDLKENAATFRGNVYGLIPRENIHLNTAKLKLVSGKSRNFEKLIGEGGVQVKQWDREVRSDHAVFTQIENDEKINAAVKGALSEARSPEQSLHLRGNVLMKADQGDIKSETVKVDLLKQHAILAGRDSSKEGRLQINANLSELEKKKQAPGDNATEEALQQQKKISLKASRAELDNSKRQAIFEGDVVLERTPEELFIKAGKVTIRLNDFQEVTFMRAENDVCFQQPGRVAKADQASFNEIDRTILLEGNAEVQSGQYHLQGNTINLYLDVSKGVAQGDNKAPIQMTILGDQSTALFNCR